MASQESGVGLPLWAKILIGLVVVGIVGFIAVCVGLWVTFKNTLSLNPEEIQRNASQIAVFEQPLPTGYKYSMGINLMGINTVVVEHQPDQQMIFLICYPKAESDPETMVAKISESGVNTGSTSAKIEKIKEKGKEAVAGETMPYVMGTMSDKNGSHEGLFGCIVPKAKQKTILIYAAEPSGKPYDLAVTEGFLKSIKEFK